ncbi:hypothetical protein [Flavobacterium commune]|uniref:hypothetical protein n=1 Tax=Flavobacterium commune TaxID=1306519 RepID=UPI0012F94B9B|nr:hypothetical protein [Flavobacterium commune]
MGNSRKKYSIDFIDFKIWAVKTCIEHKSVRLAADKLRINKNSLQHWKNLFRDGKLTLYQRSGPDSDRKETTGLRKEIKNIRMERDILQEAAGILHRDRRAVYKLIRVNTDDFPLGRCARFFRRLPAAIING